MSEAGLYRVTMTVASGLSARYPDHYLDVRAKDREDAEMRARRFCAREHLTVIRVESIERRDSK
jgi:hypothetical protein